MKIDLRQLDEFKGTLTADENVTFEDVVGDERTVACHIVVSYRRSGAAYFFHGEVSGVLDTPCYRCLSPAAFDLAGDFDLVVRRSERGEEGEDDESDDYIMLSLTEHEVSFDQHIYENVMVNIPMQIVCKEDCNGLCPSCGANLNEQSCGCEPAGDPRWNALRKLGGDPPKPVDPA